MLSSPNICMLAAENDVIPGGKVGGIGDVVRDIPRALAAQGAKVTVIVPAYGSFHRLPGAVLAGSCVAVFRGRPERSELYELYADRDPGVRYLVLHHPLFGAGGAGKVYCDDDADQPFATDATKFALFSVASLSAIKSGLIGDLDVLHLHDWHTGLAAALIRHDPDFMSLKSLRCVFSIHNLALQGIRPFAGNTSSLQAWFPHLNYDPDLLADPRWPHCVNPVAAAIRLCDRVHTVSPTYAAEIVQANDPARGFHGGEGLEMDLRIAQEQGRLVGIINGIDYPPADKKSRQTSMTWPRFMQATADEMLRLIGRRDALRSLDYVAHQRILRWLSLTRPSHIITGVGRLTDQKMALLLQPLPDGSIPLDRLLESLDSRGMLMLLGSGDKKLEQQCQQIAGKHPHFLFLNQYSQKLSDLLFDNGDLFLMPSSFEPCGISQMLAMRSAQPCFAHAVGGLKDTINDDVTGFLFKGDSLAGQSAALLKRFDEVLVLREQKPDTFKKLASAAKSQRFEWHDSAARYLLELYS